jgi:hypothetical protein
MYILKIIYLQVPTNTTYNVIINETVMFLSF